MKVDSNNISIFTSEQARPVYILTDSSLTDNNNNDITIEKIINKEISPDKLKLIKNIKLNFIFDEVMTLIKSRKQFFIVDKTFLQNLGFNDDVLKMESIRYFSDFLIFKGGKIIIIEQKNNLVNMYNDEKEINNLLNNKKFSPPIKSYLINKEWLKEYKNFYNYDLIKQNIENNIDNKDLFKSLNNKKLNQFLIDEKNLLFEEDPLSFSESKFIIYPKNFDIIKENTFNNILNEINEANGISIGKNLRKCEIYFFNNKLVILFETGNSFNVYICSKNEKNEFDINYILISNSLNLLKIILQKFVNDKYDNFDKYFVDIGFDIYQLKKLQETTRGESKCYFISIFPYNVEPNHCLGLQNVGATCYMNATLQCLCHVTSLKKYFKEKNLEQNDNNNSILTNAFNKVITNLWKISDISYYKPEEFKNVISQLNPLFKGIQANDSKDLIIFIYETLHRELNSPNSLDINSLINNEIPEELKLFRQDYFSKNYSVISNIFYCEQYNSIKCCNCSTIKSSYNIINIIIFPLEKVRLSLEKENFGKFEYVTLEDCFRHNEVPEELKGDNQIYCNQCSRLADALSSNKLYNCPKVLTIILNRGKGIEFDVEFKYPMKFNISKYIIVTTDDTNYELIGVIAHLGESSMSGHFIAYCKSPVDNNWYFYNDAIVQKCVNPEEDIISRGIPYVLFYQKIKISKENIICLYFNYNGKEGYLDVNKNASFKDFAKELKEKYTWLPIENVGFYKNEGGNKIKLDINKGLLENGIKNGEKIILENN